MQPHIQTSLAPPPVGIVVADSRQQVRANLCETIRHQSDMRVVGSFETSQDTWQSLRQRRPEVLLLDWRLPDSGGMTLLRRLNPSPGLHVILLTEERDPDILAEAMILGARGAISRSVSPVMLLRCARAVLAGELWFSRSVTRALRDKIVSGATPARPFQMLAEVLTPREQDVVKAVVRARTNREIAQELDISTQTVRHHLKSVFEKLDVSSRLELALLATRNRL